MRGAEAKWPPLRVKPRIASIRRRERTSRASAALFWEVAVLLQGHHAAKPQVIASGADLSFAPCSDDVPRAIFLRAKIASPAVNPLLFARFRGIVRFWRT